MCIKTIYHNTYSDGSRDVTERVDSCSPGFLCANPKVREMDRQIGCTKLQVKDGSLSVANRLPTPYYTDTDRRGRPPTPRSMSPPGSRDSDTDKKHRRRSAFALDPKIIHRDSKPYVPEAPVPLPMPIPIKRSSTMPYGLATPPMPTRGRRPIIVEEPAPRFSSGTVPLGPVDVLEHASRSLRRRDSHHRRHDLLSPTIRRHSRSPLGYASAEDERERAERRRKRRELRAHASVLPSSLPTYSNTDIYGSSYSSSYGSSHGSPSFADASSGPSPAVAAVKKELRWEDQMRAKQNARISSRPKLSRSATNNGPLQGEVKSILKNTSRSPSGRKVSGGDMDELYRSVAGLGIQERETSTQRRAREDRERDDAEYKDRLRNRFSMPPRSFTMGSGGRRRTEVFYPDEGRYRFS